MGQRYSGASVRRVEDRRLITGRGRYVDDIAAGNVAYAEIVRSPVPHARVVSLDTRAASQVPGVLGVFTAADVLPHVRCPMPVIEAGVSEQRNYPAQYPIAEQELVYEGEPVAIVVAENRYIVADAAALVELDVEILPAVIDLDEAVRPGSVTAHLSGPDNVAWDVTLPGRGDVDAAFAEAAVVVRERIVQQRVTAAPMESRAILADFDVSGGELTVWTSSQMPHFIRMYLAEALDVPESRLRVVSPDVGGAFGSKMGPYSEEYLLPVASKLVGRPVRWVESRTENLTVTTHGRGHVFDVEAAASRDGELLGLRVHQLSDVGAYVSRAGANAVIAVNLAGGCYRWRAVEGRSVGVLTNKMSTGPYRGAGRPEATHLCERVVDMLAAKLEMDPAELRRRNFVQEFPFENHFGLVYDSGDYGRALDEALESVGYHQFREQQRQARAQGRYLGIGIGSYVEIAGFGPSQATAANLGEVGLVESAMVRVHPSGSVSVSVGTHSHGQGHATAFAQIVADELGVDIADVHVSEGDTANTPFGHGTYGSRSIPVGGTAVCLAARKVVARARRLASHMMEAAEGDLDFRDGAFHVRGSESVSRSFKEVAFAAYSKDLPADTEQGLEAVSFFDPPNFTWPFGTHVCVVEVDSQTGVTQILRYVAVDDCGTVINPLLVEGQVHGGVLQGVGQALFEEIGYDPDTGQVMGGTFLDYLVPTIGEMVRTEVRHTRTPTPSNVLGAKGVGEAGTIASSVAVINAICDALAPFGIEHVDMPASPQRLWGLVHDRQPVGVADPGLG
ncbi:MAG TPA: molybdopterin cofactor-binding domain-containing protein [Mycobacteriales bacterium]